MEIEGYVYLINIYRMGNVLSDSDHLYCTDESLTHHPHWY
jgi:hypothetical protein